MLGEDVDYEQFHQLIQSDGINCQKKYGLIKELINDNQNCVVARWGGKLFNKIHRDQIPGLFRNQKLLKCSIGLVVLWFESYASDTRVTKLFLHLHKGMAKYNYNRWVPMFYFAQNVLWECNCSGTMEHVYRGHFTIAQYFPVLE